MTTNRRCGICRQTGHNRSNCKTAGFEAISSFYANKKKVGIANRQCSFCKNVGHTKNKCEKREMVRTWWIGKELQHRNNLVKLIVDNGIGPNAVYLRKTGSKDDAAIVMRTVYEIKINANGSPVTTVDSWNMDSDYHKSTTDVTILSHCMTPNVDHYSAKPTAVITFHNEGDYTTKLKPYQVEQLEEGKSPDYIGPYEWFLAYGTSITAEEVRKCVALPDFFTHVREEDMPSNLRKMPRKTSKKSSEEEDDEDENE